MNNNKAKYRGRFAPSPTGSLHFGSLIAASAAYLDAKANQGEFIIRIEDLDPAREIAGSDKLILKTLEQFGFEWNEPVAYQSKRTDIYQSYLDKLNAKRLIYRCQCSRRQLRAEAQFGPLGMIYPNHCRQVNVAATNRHAIRLKVCDSTITINDQVFGQISQNLLTDLGDFIIRRSDGNFAYQFAVVIDDALQQISHVVRGSDLLDSTPRQVYIQQCLSLPRPNYLHVPTATDNQRTKLSKQTGATAISSKQANKQLVQVLEFLGQAPPSELEKSSLDDIWHWAIHNWQPKSIPKLLNKTVKKSAIRQ